MADSTTSAAAAATTQPAAAAAPLAPGRTKAAAVAASVGPATLRALEALLVEAVSRAQASGELPAALACDPAAGGMLSVQHISSGRRTATHATAGVVKVAQSYNAAHHPHLSARKPKAKKQRTVGADEAGDSSAMDAAESSAASSSSTVAAATAPATEPASSSSASSLPVADPQEWASVVARHVSALLEVLPEAHVLHSRVSSVQVPLPGSSPRPPGFIDFILTPDPDALQQQQAVASGLSLSAVAAAAAAAPIVDPLAAVAGSKRKHAGLSSGLRPLATTTPPSSSSSVPYSPEAAAAAVSAALAAPVPVKAAYLSAEARAVAADPRPPSVFYTPLAHIPVSAVPESWTVTFDEPAELQPFKTVVFTEEKEDAQPAAAASDAVSESAPASSSVAAADAADSPADSPAPTSEAASKSASAPAQPVAMVSRSFTFTRVNSTPLMLRVPDFLSAAERALVLHLAYAPGAGQGAWKPYRNITYKPTVDESTGHVVRQSFELGHSESATLNQLDWGHIKPMYPLIQRLADRVARLVNSSSLYTSNLRRLLRYEPGQKFDLHADDYDRLEPLHRGRRMLTCLVYVHTEPEETGGGTVFPLLDQGSYRSAPTPGSLLIFRNFDPANGYRFDARCQHYAETTHKGSKYAINLYFVEQQGMWWH